MEAVQTPREAADLARITRLPETWPGRLPRALAACAAGLGVVALTIGLATSPERAWAGLLIAGLFLLGPGLGSLVLVALLHVTGAGWATAVRRVPEALVSLLTPALVAIAVVLIARPGLYPWWHDHLTLGGFKGWWLDPSTFYLRSLIYGVTWLLFAGRLRRAGRGSERPVSASALFLVAFALTFWLASVDWLMSFEPHWYSTIFGVYHFASLFTAGIAATILGLLWLRHQGILAHVIHAEHLHDLGKLLFAFTTFWAYTWFSQYMLIWYADLPEETAYFTRRALGDWRAVFWAVLVLHWIVPFLLLLTRRAKRSTVTLLAAACAVLAGRFLELAITVLPTLDTTRATGSPGWLEVALWACGCGAALWFFVTALGRAPLVPGSDPYLEESLSYHS